jgi:carbamoyltransferase
MTTRILSVNYETHDHTAALIEDDRILAIVSEERLSRKKTEDRAPLLAMQECLRIAGLKPEDLDFVVHSVFPKPRLKYYAWEGFAKITFTKGQSLWKSSIGGAFFEIIYSTGIPTFLVYNLWPNIKLKKVLKGFKGETRYVNHHLSHAASAFYTSGMRKCLAVVIEGSGGDFTASAWHCSENGMKPVATVPWPHSIGQFYRLVTRILGFNVRRHAGKITGLAAYGNPDAAYHLVCDLVKCEGLDITLSPLVYTLQSEYIANKKLPEYFQNYSMEDISSAFQRRLEEVATQFVKNALEATGEENLVLAGGVTANVKMNQKIYKV